MAIKFLGIEFANIFTTPLERRLQTLAALHWAFVFYFLTFIGWIVFLLMLLNFNSYYFYIALLYGAWVIYDSKTSQLGGREINWLKNSKIWNYYRDYFPIKLVKTADLERDNNYLFVYHPHGIASCGAFASFCTNALGTSTLFEGFKFHMLTLRCHFFTPFVREYIMSLGACSASKETIHHLLTNCGMNNGIVLVVGGAREALEANPGNLNLIVNRRKGFVKLALQHATPLVPIYSFGEGELYSQVLKPPDSWVRRIQNTLTGILTISPPIFHGRGVLNYTFGMLPYRRPINVVVGSPLKLPKIPNPSDEEIKTWHSKYIDHLVDLFEQHKMQYGLKEDDHIHFV